MEFTVRCVYICKSKMAAPMHLPGSEVAAFMNDARQLNIYCDADPNALNDVILDYFTSGHASDSDDDTFHEEKSDLESDIEDLTKLTAAAVGMSTTGIGHDDTEAGSKIGKGTNDNISIYLLPLCKKKKYVVSAF